MRVDKYMWHVRLFKTRAIASEACRKNQIQVNGMEVKASREVKIGDKLKIRKNQIYYEFIILGIPKSRIGAKLVEENIKNITSAEEMEKMEMMRLSKTQYVNAYREGRPTKKDRREIEGYTTTNWDDFFSDDIDDDNTDTAYNNNIDSFFDSQEDDEENDEDFL
ncbi:MAG: S4 domain-containing protein [Flavobacteriales bacterium]|nr:S4 domain-containing protein [Flavobacteriales bacterium]